MCIRDRETQARVVRRVALRPPAGHGRRTQARRPGQGGHATGSGDGQVGLQVGPQSSPSCPRLISLHRDHHIDFTRHERYCSSEMQKTLEQDRMNLDTRLGASGAGPVTKVGLVRDARHRYSWNGGPLYPSVTTILQIKDKLALVGWAKRETAACAVRNLDVLERMVRSGGPQAAVDWLKRIPDYARDASADLGSAVHAAAEAIARGEPVPLAEEVGPFIAAYRRCLLYTS